MKSSTTDLQWNTDKTIEFLQHYNPAGPWHLSAVIPDGAIETHTFAVGDERKMWEWIESKQNKKNLYFHVNQLKPNIVNKRATKQDINEINSLHTDNDIPEGANADDALPAIRQKLQEADEPPTVTIFSGGGYQGFWVLETPEPIRNPEDIEFIESLNRGLEQKFDADNCRNIDRLMRLPGTVNLPNAKKRKSGRVPTVAYVVEADWSRLYSIGDFKPGVAPTKSSKTKSAAAAASRAPTYSNPLVDENGELALPPNAPKWLTEVIKTGDHKTPRYADDRSKAVYAVASALIRLRCNDDIIIQLLEDARFAISAHCIENGNARRQVQHARDNFDEVFAQWDDQVMVRPLGYTKDDKFVLMDPERQIFAAYSMTQLVSPATLMAFAHSNFWATLFPPVKDASFNAQAAGQALAAQCRAVGPFIPQRIRGRGIFRDGGKIVVNLSREPIESAEGNVYLCFEGIQLYANAEFDTPRLLGLLQRFKWKNPNDAVLALGWLAIAVICGVLTWRPHIWIHGSSQTGKTTLHTILTTTCSPLALSCDGGSSEAGIRQTVGFDSIPVIIDEIEDDQQYIKGILRLARSASSADDPLLRGTPEGKAMAYCLRTAFALSAINPLGMSVADESRILMLELIKPDDTPDAVAFITSELAWLRTQHGRWCSMMVSRAELVVSAVEVFQAAMKSGSRRHRQNMATLLAGAYVALYNEVPSNKQASEWTDDFSETMDAHVVERDDAQECLDYLFAHRERSQNYGELPLGHWIAVAKDEEEKPEGLSDARVILQMYDMRVVWEGDKSDLPGLYIKNNSPAITKVFKDSKWRERGWMRAIRKLAGAAATKGGVRFGSGRRSPTARGTILPLSCIPDRILTAREEVQQALDLLNRNNPEGQ